MGFHVRLAACSLNPLKSAREHVRGEEGIAAFSSETALSTVRSCGGGDAVRGAQRDEQSGNSTIVPTRRHKPVPARELRVGRGHTKVRTTPLGRGAQEQDIHWFNKTSAGF